MRNNVIAMPKKWIVFVLCFTMSILAIISIIVMFDNLTIANINNEEISIKEFKFHLKIKKPEVENYFNKTYGVSIKGRQWYERFGTEVPIEVLKLSTIEEIKNIKMQQIIAKEEGIIKNISHKSFLKDLYRENNDRINLKKNNKPIFGPKQYGEQEYFAYVFSNMVLELKKSMENSDTLISNETILQFYDLHKDLYVGNNYSIEIKKLFLSYTDKDGYADDISKAEAKKQFEQIMFMLNSGKSFDYTLESFKTTTQNKLTLITENLEGINERHYSELNPTTLIKSKSLKVGEYSDMFVENAGFNVISCMSKKAHYLPYEEAKTQVKYDFINHIYNEQVRSKLNEANIKLNHFLIKLIRID